MNQKQQQRIRLEGFNQGVKQTTSALFASVALAAHREFKFGPYECARLLNEAYNITLEQLSSKEALDAVWKEVGLRINFEDPVDPVKEV